MAERVFNEFTADSKRKANWGAGGVKVGDFGTGGRVYTKEYTRRSGDNTTCLRIFAGIVSLAGLVFVYSIEQSLQLTSQAIQEASYEAVPLYAPVSESYNNGKLIFTSTDPAKPPELDGPPPRDHFFNIAMDSSEGVGRRVSEYCQWQQTRHTKQVKIGQEPDYCGSSGSGSDCGGVNCRGLSVSSCGSRSGCCSVKQGASRYREEVWYTYHKAWRSHTINSLMFDNPAAYHNPQRDPAPSQTFFGGEPAGVNLAPARERSLRISARDLEPSMSDWRIMHLRKSTVEGISQKALAAGFGEADHQHFYSRVPKDGLNSPVARAAASYLIDGVIDVNEISRMTGIESLLGGAGLDWITKGTCNAGDIRAHFESRSLPDSVSLLGRQVAAGGGSGRIVPHTFSNGHQQLFMQRGVLDLDSLLTASIRDIQSSTNWQRFFAVLVFVLAATLVGLTASALHGAMFGLFACGTTWGLVWALFYGAVAAVVPLVAAVAAAFWWSKNANGDSTKAKSI